MLVPADTPGKSLAYLSGAPRVSTRPEAGAIGPRAHVLGVMDAFRHLGWEVRSYIVGDRVPLAWVRGEQSAAALRRNWLRRVVADLVRLGMGILNGWWAWREIGRVDLVYERYGAFQALGWWFQRQGIPWILETNELYFVNATKDRSVSRLERLLKRHERWAYHQCDVLVCISQALADLVVKETGVPSEKIVVLPNGVDVHRLDPAVVRPRRLFEGATIGFVGQLAEWQRLDLLLEAVAELKNEGVNYHVTIVGDGTMCETWEAHARALGLAERVRFVGYVPWDEVPSYIAGFDLGYAGAVPLAAGTMYLSPLKLYEYAAMGKPVIAAAYADAEALVADGVKGYLFTPGDLEGLKRSLRQAFAERTCWASTASETRRVIMEKHSWEVRIRQLIAEVSIRLGWRHGTSESARR